MNDEIYSGSSGYSGQISYALIKSFCNGQVENSRFSLDTVVSD